jgi:hypothetical protein
MARSNQSIEAQGTGVARSTIVDERGTCAHVLQPLLITPIPRVADASPAGGLARSDSIGLAL